MKKTNNLGLSLYESNDKFNITASENSLNANMEIIDEAIGNIVNDLPSKLPQSNLAQNDPTQPDYVQNRTHWEEDPVETSQVVWENETPVDGQLVYPEELNISDNSIFNINIDGVDYTSGFSLINAPDMGMCWVAGNIAMLGLSEDDNGMPFAFAYIIDLTVGLLAVASESPVSANISEVTKTIHKLDNKFLDLEWFPAKNPITSEIVEILPEMTIETEEEGDLYTAYHPCEIKPFYYRNDAIYHITLDGTTYSIKGLCDPNGTMVLGNITMLNGVYESGEPFAIMLSTSMHHSVDENGVPNGFVYDHNYDFYSFTTTTGGTHTLSISIEHPIYEQLPEKYTDKLNKHAQDRRNPHGITIEQISDGHVSYDDLENISGTKGNIQKQIDDINNNVTNIDSTKQEKFGYVIKTGNSTEVVIDDSFAKISCQGAAYLDISNSTGSLGGGTMGGPTLYGSNGVNLVTQNSENSTSEVCLSGSELILRIMSTNTRCGDISIKGVASPTEDNDAVNKKYVDDAIAALIPQLTEQIKAQLAEEAEW